MERLFGCIRLPHLAVSLISSTPWDGSPVERLGVLLSNSPRKQRDRVREFYSDFSPVASLVGEMLTNEAMQPAQPVDDPLCLISQLCDNIYLLLCNVPSSDLPDFKQALASLLRVICGIKRNWELHVGGGKDFQDGRWPHQFTQESVYTVVGRPPWRC